MSDAKNIRIKIIELKEFDHMIKTFGLIKQLNPQLKKEKFYQMLNEMISNGYKMIAAYNNKKCVGVSGYWISTKIYSGKFLEIDNLIVDNKFRSIGIGKKLCKYMKKIAVNQKCETIMLDAYAENSNAHRFYYREGFFVRGFHFIKKL